MENNNQLQTLNQNIQQWFTDRNLIEADPHLQLVKLMEEFGELAAGVARSDKDKIKDSIGDLHVVYTGLAAQLQHQNYVLNEPPSDGVASLLLATIVLERLLLSAMYFHFNDDTPKEEKQKVFSDMKEHFQDIIAQVAKTYDLTLEDCVQAAYDEIKDRKGKLVNGVFVKEEDLKGE